MAHKKGQGSSRNGRDSNPQMLGIKLFGGPARQARQHSLPAARHAWHPGKNVGVGRDWTIFSLIEGKVLFDQGGRRINVIPSSRHPSRAEAAANSLATEARKNATCLGGPRLWSPRARLCRNGRESHGQTLNDGTCSSIA